MGRSYWKSAGNKLFRLVLIGKSSIMQYKYGAHRLKMSFIFKQQHLMKAGIVMYTLISPAQVSLGAGCVCEVQTLARSLKAKHICLLLDPTATGSRQRKRLEQMLTAFELTFIDSITSEPTFAMILSIYNQISWADIDCIVAIGGGSIMDSAKILSVLGTNPLYAKALTDTSLITQEPIPWIAVPTTAGTGAEATPNAILLNEKTHEKIGIISSKMVARYVLLDSDFTATMPPQLAAYTGFDALAHALESYLAMRTNPFLEPYSIHAIKLIFANLDLAVHGNEQAINCMQLAAFYAGTCLVVSNTCAVHAIAYPLSGIYHVPHAVSVAVLLAQTVSLLLPGCTKKLAFIARQCSLCPSQISDEQAAQSVVQKIIALQKATGAFCNLKRAYGVSEEMFEKMARDAREIKRLFDFSPLKPSLEEIVGLYENVYLGVD